MIIHGTALTATSSASSGRGGKARLVAAVKPSSLRRDDRRRRAGDGAAGGPRRRLAAERQHQPAGGDQGRPALPCRAGHEPGAEAAGSDGDPDAATIAGLEDELGRLEEGRPADLVVFERREEDPWESVVEATPPRSSW